MSRNAAFVGTALIIIGVGAWLLSESRSATALIPAALGALLVILGVAANAKPDMSHHFMHGAAMVALLGVLGSLGSLLGRWNGDDGYLAEFSQAATIVLCAGLLYLAVQSFRAARIARTAQSSA